MLGGDCEFLGFPYGGGWRARFANGQSFWMPFVKHCFVSAIGAGGQQIYVLDGINNAGFSSGPVVFRTGPEQKIMAVVSGYRQEPAEVVFSSSASQSHAAGKNTQHPTAETRPPTKGTVNVNSGFIIAYGIQYATEAIRKNPIGALRKPN